jgi:membrane associated rhomboid family serine protease
VTSMFLHASILHLAFNMVALYWLGSIVEQTIGTMRFLLVYFASGLAGSAGALLLTEPFVPTVGASGAIFGIMGALLVLEYRATGSFAGPALGLIAVSLAMTFITPNISIGGHLGGLAGGILATFALSHFSGARARSIGPALVGLIAVASLVLAYVRVESYVL